MKKLFGIVLFGAFAYCMFGVVEKSADAQVAYGAYCCDAGGYRRCVLPAYAPVGTGCFCYGQGTGWTCQ